MGQSATREKKNNTRGHHQQEKQTSRSRQKETIQAAEAVEQEGKNELLDNAEGTYQRRRCEHSLPHSQQQQSRAITAKYKEQARLRVELTTRRLLPTRVDSSGNASAQGGETMW